MPKRRLGDRLNDTLATLTGTAPSAASTEAVTTDVPQPLPARPTGPFDLREVTEMTGYVDLGPLLLPARPDVEMRVEFDAAGNPAELLVVHEGWQLRLDVFAAPRTEGTWEQVAAEIRSGMEADGLPVTTTHGPYGSQLHVMLSGPSGEPVPLRLVGVDGPGWLLRATLQAPLAPLPDPVVHDDLESSPEELTESTTGASATAPTVSSTDTGVDATEESDVSPDAGVRELPVPPEDVDGLPGGVLGQMIRAAVVRRTEEPRPVGSSLPLVIDPVMLGQSVVPTDPAAGPVTPSRFAHLPGLEL